MIFSHLLLEFMEGKDLIQRKMYKILRKLLKCHGNLAITKPSIETKLYKKATMRIIKVKQTQLEEILLLIQMLDTQIQNL